MNTITETKATATAHFPLATRVAVENVGTLHQIITATLGGLVPTLLPSDLDALAFDLGCESVTITSVVGLDKDSLLVVLTAKYYA